MPANFFGAHTVRPLTLFRRCVSRFGVFAVALAAALTAVQGVVAPSAHADPANEHTIIYWNITGMNQGASADVASNYSAMLGQLRNLAGHGTGPGFGDTTQAQNRLIEMRVIDNNDLQGAHRLSLYFWADNLYLVGFTSSGQNYGFNEEGVRDPNAPRVRAIMQRVYGGAQTFNPLTFRETYGSLDGSQQRVGWGFNPTALHADLRRLMNLHSENSTSAVRRAIVQTIAATSEAGRYETIARVVRDDVAYGGTQGVGTLGVALENGWSELSSWVHDAMAHPDETPHRPLAFMGGTYLWRNLTELRIGNTQTAGLGYVLTLGSARR